MPSTSEAVYRILGKKPGDFSTDRNGGHCGHNRRLDPESEQYDPDGFREERGERMMECERDEE